MEAKANTEKAEEIQYEEVTLQVPVKIMNWLRALQEGTGETVLEQIQYIIVNEVRANIDGISGAELIDWFGLDPIFLQLLNYR
jgi:hypothetical protein